MSAEPCLCGFSYPVRDHALTPAFKQAAQVKSSIDCFAQAAVMPNLCFYFETGPGMARLGRGGFNLRFAG